MEIDIHVEYEDAKTRFDIATELIVNFPYPGFARMPVEFGLENIYFHAQLKVVVSQDFSKLKIFFTSPPEYDMFFSNAFGYRQVLRNVPKLTSIINKVINHLLTERLVYPQFVEVNLDDEAVSKDVKKTKEVQDTKTATATPAAAAGPAKILERQLRTPSSARVSTPIAIIRRRMKRQDHSLQSDEEGDPLSEKFVDMDDMPSSASQFRRHQENLEI